MTLDQLRNVKSKEPFSTFAIHMTEGGSFLIDDPESLVIHRDWNMDAIVLKSGGLFSFIYMKNVTRVSGGGGLPKMRGRRSRGNGGDD